MKLKFTVPGPPQPKERARQGKGRRWYTPERTRRYEEAVRENAQHHVFLRHGVNWRTDAQYHVELAVYFQDARSRDLDNVCKSVLDACNEVLWRDDRQVVKVTMERCIDRENPRTEVTIEAREVA